MEKQTKSQVKISGQPAGNKAGMIWKGWHSDYFLVMDRKTSSCPEKYLYDCRILPPKWHIEH